MVDSASGSFINYVLFQSAAVHIDDVKELFQIVPSKSQQIGSLCDVAALSVQCRFIFSQEVPSKICQTARLESLC